MADNRAHSYFFLLLRFGMAAFRMPASVRNLMAVSFEAEAFFVAFLMVVICCWMAISVMVLHYLNLPM